ncbi:MAG: aldo/keto reductase [Chloroflexi bacterium]|nr:aldo/keto reductase [Chloroflexota bacterium]
MDHRHLGSSGLEVSVLGLGTNNFGSRCDEETTARVLDQALDLGVTFIDTANIYSGTKSEEFIGKALRGKRDKFVLGTKFAMGGGTEPNSRGGSRKHIMDQIDKSLRRLDTDYVDLYQIHIADPGTPIEETLRALDDLVRQGKVRYIGCSNFAAWQVSEAVWTSRTLNLTSFVSVQPYYNLLKRDIEKELVPFCKKYDVGIVPFFPLESGLLTGKYRQGEPAPKGSRMDTTTMFSRVLNEGNFRTVAALERFAQERDHTVGELAIAWLLANPTVSSVIAGATKPEQVVANAKAVDWELSDDDLKEIDKIAPAA